MNCDFISKYQVKIEYQEKNNASGVIVMFDEFPNNFFVFTAKHTFNNDEINIDNVLVKYKNEAIAIKSYIQLELDIVIFIFDNSVLPIDKLEKFSIGHLNSESKQCAFSGYPSNVDGSYCEEAEYNQQLDEIAENLYRIIPIKGSDSFKNGGLKNAKGYSGSGLFNENNEIVGIVKEHEKEKSAFHYIALNPLKDELMNKINDKLYNNITIPFELIEEIKNNNVVLFVGNEFSTNFGFPSKADLLDEVLNRVDDKYSFIKMGIDSGGMSEDMAFNLLEEESDVIKTTIKEFYSTTPQNRNFIKTLWKFTTDIVTVNFDKLLEEGIEGIKIISSENNFETPTNKNFKKLFKIHGDIDYPLIFEKEYKEVYTKRELKAIQNYFRDKTCLFIGFSTDEIYFELLYNAIGNKKRNYIVSTTKEDYSKFNFESIYIENYLQLSKAFNDALKEEIEIAKKNNIKTIVKTDIKRSIDTLSLTKVCIYLGFPLNSNFNFQDKIGVIRNIFKKYEIEIFFKVLNEDELLDSIEYDHNFIFTKTNKNKIIIEDEDFSQKSIDLYELEEFIESSNSYLFLDKKIEESNYQILDIEDGSKIKKVLTSFIHRNKFFNKGKMKENSLTTELPELIDKKNLNNFVGRVTDLENIIKKILTVKEENRILTIKGSGGVGKTTIISKAVVEMADRGKFEEGIKFVQCEFIRDYEDFENKISHAFDMTNALEFKKQLKEQDLDENRLIILDNVETLLCVEDSVEIKELIRFISDYATIVITSREILNEIDYEEVYELHKLTTDEAEELFLKLYPMILPLNKATKKLLRVSILENLLDNNPLAIKLITKNLLKGKSLESLKEELEESFFDITSEDIENIFDKESDINIERTQSLFQSINYSYTRLNEKEKLVLELLSLFPDGIHLENFKNFYKENQKNLLEDKKKSKKVNLNTFSERDIKSLEDKSLLIINNGFVMLQSIIGRFSAYRFNQRDKAKKEKYYKKAYDLNKFIILIVTNAIKNNFKGYVRSAIFDANKNNFIKSLKYITSLEKEDSKLRYIDRLANTFAQQGSYNKQLLKQISYIKEHYLTNDKEKDFLESIDMGLKYYYGDFDFIYQKIQEKFPLDTILANSLETNLDSRFITNILGIYDMEGYELDYIKFHIKENLFSDHDSIFKIGKFEVAKKILDKVQEKDFFEYEFELAIDELDIDELKRYVKSIFKTKHIMKVQATYTLLKADRESVDIKMIKKLIPVNPFSDGLKLLMLAMKSEDKSNKDLKTMYEQAIEKLYHIRYYHVEAILIYCHYLQGKNDEEYQNWFTKGIDLAKKHHYRYLEHQFLCLDTGVYTKYHEEDYPLPEKLDFSKMLKKI